MATIFTDDFNSYNDGDLVGQGSWAEQQFGSYYDIQGTIVKEGAKAIKVNPYVSAQAIIYKSGTSRSAGKTTYYIRKTLTTTSFLVLIEQHSDLTGAIVKFDNDGNIKYFNGSVYVTIQAYSADTWYSVEIQWADDSGTKKARYRINEGTWSSYYAMNGNPSNLDSVRFLSERPSTGYTYIDHIDEDPIVVTDTSNFLLMF